MKNFWKKWQRIAKKIGDFQARVILTTLYFVVIGPFALLVRWGADPFAEKPPAERLASKSRCERFTDETSDESVLMSKKQK